MRMQWMIGMLLCGLVAVGPAAAKKSKAGAQDVADDPAALVARAQEAMGGAEGGHVALAALPGYRLTYRMEAHDTLLGKSYTADHVFERSLDGATRLEVKLLKGSGEDSVAYAGAEEAWVQVDGTRNEFTPEEVLGRVDDFAPESLFQVPLDIATRGLESFPEELRSRLVVDAPAEGAQKNRVLIRGIDTAGVEQLTLTLHTGTGRPTRATFLSVAGQIEYHFDDYREVAPQVVIPFRRTFLRNGVLLSDLTVTGFEALEAPAEEGEETTAEGAPGEP